MTADCPAAAAVLETPRLDGAQRAVLDGAGPRTLRPTVMRAEIAEAAAIARGHGLDVVGAGSSRVAVAADDDTIAKLAHNYVGLMNNLGEAAAWLQFPPTVRQCLAPCVELTPQLCLVQQRVEPLGVPGTAITGQSDEAWRAADGDEATQAMKAAQILLCRGAMGLPTEILRCNNYGRHGGRVVALDYGNAWLPIGGVWVWLLQRLEAGPVTLDEAERVRMYGSILKRGREFFTVRGPTVLDLGARAGVPLDPCPCETSCAGRCGLHASAVEWAFESAQIRHVRPSRPTKRPRPRTRREALELALVESAGIRDTTPRLEYAPTSLWNDRFEHDVEGRRRGRHGGSQLPSPRPLRLAQMARGETVNGG